MKIAFLHRDLPPDTYTGAAMQVHRLAEALVDLGHSVDVFTLSQSTGKATYRVQTLFPSRVQAFFARMPGWKRLWIPWLFRNLPVDAYDVLHVHGDGFFLGPRPHSLRTFYGTAALERRHGRGYKSWLAQTLALFFEKRESRQFTLAVGIGSHIQTHLPGITHILPCMVDSAYLGEAGLQSPWPTLIHVGSLHGRKRGALALGLWKRLREKGYPIRLHLVCPGSERKSFRASSPQEGLFVHSHIDGETLARLYRESWIVLSLADYEGFGVALIEGMACGCIPLSAPHAGARDVLGEAWPQALCPVESMADRIALWLDSGEIKPETRGKAAEFAKKFRPESLAASHVELYRKVQSEKAR